MDEHKTNSRQNPAALRVLVSRLLAICLVLYWLYEIVSGYLAGGPEAPSKTLLILAIVVLGGGAVLLAVITFHAWKREKESSAAAVAEEPSQDDVQDQH